MANNCVTANGTGLIVRACGHRGRRSCQPVVAPRTHHRHRSRPHPTQHRAEVLRRTQRLQSARGIGAHTHGDDQLGIEHLTPLRTSPNAASRIVPLRVRSPVAQSGAITSGPKLEGTDRELRKLGRGTCARITRADPVSAFGPDGARVHRERVARLEWHNAWAVGGRI